MDDIVYDNDLETIRDDYKARGWYHRRHKKPYHTYMHFNTSCLEEDHNKCVDSKHHSGSSTSLRYIYNYKTGDATNLVDLIRNKIKNMRVTSINENKPIKIPQWNITRKRNVKKRSNFMHGNSNKLRTHIVCCRVCKGNLMKCPDVVYCRDATLIAISQFLKVNNSTYKRLANANFNLDEYYDGLYDEYYYD